MRTNIKLRRRKAASTKPIILDHRASLARRLDQLADHNLHLGFHVAAEQLAHRAAQLREGAR